MNWNRMFPKQSAFAMYPRSYLDQAVSRCDPNIGSARVEDKAREGIADLLMRSVAVPNDVGAFETDEVSPEVLQQIATQCPPFSMLPN